MNAIDQQLFAACKNGDYLQVNALLAQGANPNALNENRQTPLMIAARYGHADIINLLVRYGADTRIKDDQGRNALHHAIENQQYDVARHLILKYQLNPNESTYSCQDAISLAARNGNIAFMDFLFQNGAKPRAKALEEAILQRHVHVVRHLILKYGLDPNISFKDNVTPFLLAAQVGDIPMLETLVELGAIPNHIDAFEHNAVHIATKKKNHNMMRHLLTQYRFDPNARTRHDHTALMIAAQNGDLIGFDILLQHDANHQLTDRHGYNALLLAVANRHLDLVSHLLNRRLFDVNKPSNDNRTAFLIAAANHDIPMLDLLAQYGANPHHCDDGKNNAIAYAIEDHKTVHHLITRYGVNPNIEDAWGRTPLFLLIRNCNDENRLIHLIKHGADPHYVNRYGQNAIHFAVGKRSYTIIRRLVTTFMVNLNQCDCNGFTPFLLAAATGDVFALHLLAMLGANIQHTDNMGRDALHIAAEKGNPEATRYLITHLHFDPNAVDRYGCSPLARAIKGYFNRGNESYIETIETLIALGSHLGVSRMNDHKTIDKYLFTNKNLRYISRSMICL